MMEQQQKTIKPFWGRVTVIASPVDEEQHSSGLIVPVGYNGAEYDLQRGVVIDVDHKDSDYYSDRLQSGTVVYYRRSYRLGDLQIVEPEDIYAYEEGA